MRITRTFVFFAIAFAILNGCSAEPSSNGEPVRTDELAKQAPTPVKVRQTEFHAEKDIARKAEVPPEVRSVVLKSQSLPTSCATSQEGFAECFEASEIDIGNDDRPDLVVKAVGMAMGANMTYFYVFKGGPDGYELVLNIPALFLNLVETENGKTMDIEAGASTTNTETTLRFAFVDGRYRISDPDFKGPGSVSQ